MGYGRAVELGKDSGAGMRGRGEGCTEPDDPVWRGACARERRPAYHSADGTGFRMRENEEEGFSDREAHELEELAQRIGRRSAHLHAAEQELAAGFGTTGPSDRVEPGPENGPAGPWAEDEAEITDVKASETDTAPPGPAGPQSEAPSTCTCGGHPAPLMGTRAEHYQAFLYLDPAALAREGDPTHTHLEDGTRLAADTARRLTCDGAVVPVVAGGEAPGNDDASVLDIGRRTRTIPPAVRRALRLRDGGCRFPGCGLRFAEGHHIRHWALGGPTSLDNLVSLCRFHHRAVHEDGFRVERGRDGELAFFSPEGWPLGDGPPRVNVELGDPAVEIVRENRRRGISPRWHAASADYEREVHVPDELLFRAWEAVEGA